MTTWTRSVDAPLGLEAWWWFRTPGGGGPPAPPQTVVRDSKNLDGGVLVVRWEDWAAFIGETTR